MAPATSPRLPGVPVLGPDATGPEYSRWRRAFRFACEKKGTWKYCNGRCPMPMPKASPTCATHSSSPEISQPSLFEERRAWVRKDREVKLDMFLSLHEDVMQEVFEVGPPLPPSSLSAKQMLDALNNHFAEFKFEAYHHAFCHFLNIHMDQFRTVEEFNQEFSTTLEDLLDYGQPLSNAQACSAYFSKLRCSQNPWVVNKLAEWDSQETEPEIVDLMKESPPWSYIRPLATKTSQNFHVEAIQEEPLEDSSDSEASEHSMPSPASSRTTHSRQGSVATRTSQEITVHKDFDVHSPGFGAKTPPIPLRHSSKDRVPGTSLSGDVSEVPVAIDFKKAVTRVPVPAPVDRPLPPLPSSLRQSVESDKRSRSPSPHIVNAMSKNLSSPNLSVPVSSLKLETTYPSLRPRTPTPTPPLSDHPAFRTRTPTPDVLNEQADIHPALRSRTPTPTAELSAEPSPAIAELSTATSAPIPITRGLPQSIQAPELVSSLPNLAVPWPFSPNQTERPQSARDVVHPSQPAQEDSKIDSKDTYKEVIHEAAEMPAEANEIKEAPGELVPVNLLNRSISTSSSIFNLPLQGTRDSAWEYLHESRNFLCSPSNPPEPPTPTSAPDEEITALPSLKETHSRTPTFTDVVIPPSSPPSSKAKPRKTHTASSSISKPAGSLLPVTDKTVKRSESPFEFSDEAENKVGPLGKKLWKKGSWNIPIDLTRFSSHKGVREII